VGERKRWARERGGGKWWWRRRRAEVIGRGEREGGRIASIVRGLKKKNTQKKNTQKKNTQKKTLFKLT
jgi:hypothetical protein